MPQDDASRISLQLTQEQYDVLLRGNPLCVRAESGCFVSIVPPEFRETGAPAVVVGNETVPVEGVAAALRNQLSHYKALADAAATRHH